MQTLAKTGNRIIAPVREATGPEPVLNRIKEEMQVAAGNALTDTNGSSTMSVASPALEIDAPEAVHEEIRAGGSDTARVHVDPESKDCQISGNCPRLGGGNRLRCSVRIAEVAIFLQRFLNDVVELRRHTGIEPRQRHGLLIQNGIKDDCRGLAAKRRSTCRHLVEDSAEGE